ncbi:MAG: YdcF family protein [Clostridia bacterium]|nr:YdcF family protein [Clostridia bacterium]
MKRLFKKILIGCSAAALLCALFVAAANLIVIRSTSKYLLTAEQATELEGAECILVLGCGVRGDTPSPLLADRLRRGVELYDGGCAPKLLMSGDHGQKHYDEVNVMKQYAVDEGIDTADIFMDHAGFSTYESMYRARDVFGVKKMIIVTQQYHLYRAVYIARSLGIEAYGVASDYQSFSGQTQRDVRETAARAKDLIYCIVRPQPTYLGESIPINGDGNVTNG